MTESLFGTWWDPQRPDEQWPGRLTWNPAHQPELELLDAPFHFTGGGQNAVAMVLGRVDRVGYVTLLDCTPSGAHFAAGITGRYRVGHALTGIHLAGPDERFIRRIELEVPTLALVLGGRPPDFARVPTSRTRVMRINVDHRRLAWTDDEVAVEFRYVWIVQPDSLGLDITMSPQVYLSSRNSQSFEWWYQRWLVPLAQLVQVMCGELFVAKRFSLWMKKGITRMDRAARGINVWQAGIDPEASVDVWTSDRRRVPPLATRDQLAQLHLPGALRNTRDHRTRHEVFSDLLTSAMVDRDRPRRNRYLDAITAIEAHDFVEHGEGPIDREAFTDRRNDALSAVTNPGAKRFLKSWMPRRSSFSLAERLERTRRAVGLTWDADAATMAQLRNDIAHGNPPPDTRLLDVCLDQALHAARLLALHDVGVRTA